MATAGKLTPKQERFVAEYLIDLCATQAAIRAGYEFLADAACFYTYLLVDPRCGGIFYVGKGKGSRAASHVRRANAGIVDNAEKFKRIEVVHGAGCVVREVIFSAHENEKDAYGVERELIAALRATGLTNIAGGVVTNEERVATEAKVLLGRMKSYDEWALTASDRALESAVILGGSPQACYEYIRGALLQVAETC